MCSFPEAVMDDASLFLLIKALKLFGPVLQNSLLFVPLRDFDNGQFQMNVPSFQERGLPYFAVFDLFEREFPDEAATVLAEASLLKSKVRPSCEYKSVLKNTVLKWGRAADEQTMHIDSHSIDIFWRMSRLSLSRS
jgi:hypothetical protein